MKTKIPYDLLGQAIIRHLKPSPAEVGQHPLMGTAKLQLACVVAKREPYEAASQQQIPWASLVARLFKAMDIKPEEGVQLLSAAFVLPDPPEGCPFLASVCTFAKCYREAQPKTLKEGATIVSGKVKIVGWSEG